MDEVALPDLLITVTGPTGAIQFHLDVRRHRLFLLDPLGPVELGLDPRAFSIFVMLVKRAGKMVPKGEIIKAVWPERQISDCCVHFQISRLRAALGQKRKQSKHGTMQDSCIKAVPRVGWILEATVTPIHPEPPVPSSPRTDRYGKELIERIEEVIKELVARQLREVLIAMAEALEKAFEPPKAMSQQSPSACVPPHPAVDQTHP